MNNASFALNIISDFAKDDVMRRIGTAIDYAVESGLTSSEELDTWLDSCDAIDLPDFVWHAVYAVVAAMEGIEGMED